jgi:hypothetical protein
VTEDVTAALARLPTWSFALCFSMSIAGCMRVGVHQGDGEVEYVRVQVSLLEEAGGGPEPILYGFSGE